MDDDDRLIAPYVEWAAATDFRYLEGNWFRVLLELNGSAASFAGAVTDARIADLVRVPSIYRTPSREFDREDMTFCMAIMTQDALKAFVDIGARDQIVARLRTLSPLIRRIELGTPALTQFEPSPAEVSTEPLLSVPSQKAIVAIIDDGLAFAHERFRSANTKTRFKYFWNQDESTGSSTAGFGWGLELTQCQINDHLEDCNHCGIVDEDEVYRRTSQNLVARRASHGTHVMDVACGLDMNDVGDDSPYLIGVQLPKWVTQETSGALLTPVVHAAIAYILNRADLIAAEDDTAPLPIVINLSYGSIAGPHDGSGPLEAALDQWIAARQLVAPLSIVLPAGNNYLSRCHASFRMAAWTKTHTPVQQLNWRVQPDDKASSFVEIWLPKLLQDGTRPNLAIRIETPTGEYSPPIKRGEEWRWPSHNDLRFRARYYHRAGRRPWIKLAMAPTSEMTSHPRTAPSGTWKIIIENHGSAIDVEAWVQRGDTPFGHPLWGRQSRFDDPNYVRFDLAGRPKQQDDLSSVIRRRGTQNALATGKHVTVIGGIRLSDRTASEYSGSGPIQTPLTGPDASAIADDSVALHGVLAAGTRSGSTVALRGTSVGAPQVTRRISEQMTKRLPSDRVAVQLLARNGDPNAPLPGSPLEERLGKGRIAGPEPVSADFRRKGA